MSMKMQQNKEKKDAFLRICPSERWACCCFVCLAEPDSAQPSDKQKQDLYIGLSEEHSFFVLHKIQRGDLHMGNGKAIAKNRFSSGTGNRQLYLRIFCFCIILLYTQRRKHVCFASPFLCCFSPDETEKPKQHMLSGSSSFLAPFTCS